MNLACRAMCKLLLQVKQKFVIYFSSLKRPSRPSSVWRGKEQVFGCGYAALCSLAANELPD
jgi:hypothetical protein